MDEPKPHRGRRRQLPTSTRMSRGSNAQQNTFVARWTPRVGRQAAVLQFRARILVGGGGLSAGFWGLLLVFGYRLHLRALTICGYSLMMVACTAILVGCVFLVTSFRSISSFLGIKVSVLNSPMLNETAFKRWCVRNGI